MYYSFVNHPIILSICSKQAICQGLRPKDKQIKHSPCSPEDIVKELGMYRM